MYVRDLVTDDVERVVVAVNRFLVQVESIAQCAAVDGLEDEAQALVDAASALPDFLTGIGAWASMAGEAERDWRSFLATHPELSS